MKSIYIGIVVVIVSFSFALIYKLSNISKSESGSIVNPKISLTPTKDYPPIPILKTQSVELPPLTSESIFVVDVNSGVSLYEKNPDEQLLPASTTKIVTALVAIDYYNPEEIVTVRKPNVEGQKMGLFEGEQITVGDLLAGLLIHSANDAAEVLAQNYPGGREAFVAAMNNKARDLHLENTFFTNPSGLDGLGLTTTARDLARESAIAMKIPIFRDIVGTKEKLVSSVDGVYTHKLTNINELVGVVPGVLGVKTGWTENAKENLVTYVKRDNNDVVFIVLKSTDRFGETRTLIDWIFESYEWKKVSI